MAYYYYGKPSWDHAFRLLPGDVMKFLQFLFALGVFELAWLATACSLQKQLASTGRTRRFIQSNIEPLCNRDYSRAERELRDPQSLMCARALCLFPRVFVSAHHWSSGGYEDPRRAQWRVVVAAIANELIAEIEVKSLFGKPDPRAE